jgi:hypothetical protein
MIFPDGKNGGMVKYKIVPARNIASSLSIAMLLCSFIRVRIAGFEQSHLIKKCRVATPRYRRAAL